MKLRPETPSEWFLAIAIGFYAVAQGVNCYYQFRLVEAQERLLEVRREAHRR